MGSVEQKLYVASLIPYQDTRHHDDLLDSRLFCGVNEFDCSDIVLTRKKKRDVSGCTGINLKSAITNNIQLAVILTHNFMGSSIHLERISWNESSSNDQRSGPVHGLGKIVHRILYDIQCFEIY